MPGTPLIWVSIGVVTVCSTVCASAPVKLLVTWTVEGVISGYWLIGKLNMASTPTIKRTRDITIAVTGRLIKVSAIISYLLSAYQYYFASRDYLLFKALPAGAADPCGPAPGLPAPGCVTCTTELSLNFCT